MTPTHAHIANTISGDLHYAFRRNNTNDPAELAEIASEIASKIAAAADMIPQAETELLEEYGNHFDGWHNAVAERAVYLASAKATHDHFAAGGIGGGDW